MAFIPKGAVWYVAQIVLEIKVEGEVRNVVHINYLLVEAKSPEEALEKTLRFGVEHETTYSNQEGKTVTISFRGLRNLTVVYDGLEDGAELLYEEKVAISQSALSALVRPKESLGIFKPIEKSSGPDYASAEIQREARRMVEQSK